MDDEMPTDVRLTLLLRRVEGVTIEEVAAMMETSIATVKRRLAKAEEVLRNYREGES